MNSPAIDTRYAIYVVPEARSELYRFGAAVLGYDCYTGADVDYPNGAGPGWAETTREPRQYGFHGTLKAPIRLAAGTSATELEADVDAFARARPVVDVGPLRVAAIGSFVALVPAGPCAALNELAAACVERFDRFRAPLDDKELARRLASPLTERQRDYVGRWGYPYVFDEFRFHMTLTGALAHDHRAAALHWLQSAFAARPAAQHLTIDRLVIARQDGGGTFRVVHSSALAARK